MTYPKMLRPGLARIMPDRMRNLPRDIRGYPIPWGCHRNSAGVPDFKIINGHKIEQAVVLNRCWICGGTMGRNKAFVVGTFGVVKLACLEPPSHRECAIFALRVCPHLSRPMRDDIPAAVTGEPVVGVRTSGIYCVWVTREFGTVPFDDALLFKIGEPVEVSWFCTGRPATRSEVVRALDRAIAIMIDIARDESEQAVNALLQLVHNARRYLPPEGKANVHQPSDAPAEDCAGEQGTTAAHC